MTSRIVTLVHLTGVVIFLGTFVATWLVYVVARRSREPAALAELFALVNLGDRWLTPGAVVAIIGSGWYLSRLAGLSVTGTGWILWSFTALGLSGVVFVARLHRLQSRLEAAPREPEFDVLAYRGLLNSWARWAAVGTTPVLIAFGLMILRPALPGL